MLDTALPSAPRSQDVLMLAAALAKLIWRRLDEAEERIRLRAEVHKMRTQGDPVRTFLLAGARLGNVAQKLQVAAQDGLSVHLYGEDGTEKELLARHLHGASDRSAGPFVTFHCSLVPESRAEEELLGTGEAGPDGSMIGGNFARAHGGLLYIEQPELLGKQVQDRLADLIARGSHSGGPGSQKIPIDVRVVSASNEVPIRGSKGTRGPDPQVPRMRQALAESLLGITVEVPPLRSEPAEIAPLAELILSEMGPAADGAPRSLTDSARRLLMEYSWPGNLRQLRRTLEFAAARAGSQPIAPRFLPPEVQTGTVGDSSPIPTLAELERQHILKVLEACGGNRREVAARLGIAISTLYEKLRRLEAGT